MLIDTSGFFAIHSEEDKRHTQADKIYESSRLRLTTSYVLAEYVALALIRGLPREQALTFSKEVLDDATVEIV